MSREELLKPETCKDCHPKHYREWASSMHAYAAEDPVFVAMNRRGQRETDHGLGQFCVKCHAPMAVIEGATVDGLNLDEVPSHLKGVTCYFCHNARGVDSDSNAFVELANDTTMRGGIRDPVPSPAHDSEHSEYHDRERIFSSVLCGGCHDIKTPNGVLMERTFREYIASAFYKPGPSFETCPGCHMQELPGVAVAALDANAPLRTAHDHLWPGVDVALTEFPDREAQRLAVECALSNGTRLVSLEATPSGEFAVTLETNAGHQQPSGAAQDRRMWLEFIAYDEAGRVVFQSGNIADGEIEDKPEDHPDHDPNLWIFRDRIYDASGQEVHMFWQAAPSEQFPDGYTNDALPARSDAAQSHSRSHTYRVPTAAVPARVAVRLRMRPIGVDVLQDLVDSGDLDPSVISQVPTFTLYGAAAQWTAEDGVVPMMRPEPAPSCEQD